MTTWLLASGDLTLEGGMDSANHGLATYLAETGRHVHIVAHRVSADLAARPAVHVHRAWRPFGSHRAGEPLLRRRAARWHDRLSGAGVHTIANGGNIDVGDVVWFHYVHAAHPSAAPRHEAYLRDERRAVERARLILCNSHRTRADVVTLLGADPAHVQVVYYGTDPARFRPPTPAERAAARRALNVEGERRVALFVGALGDRRKAFDTVFDAWSTLSADPRWRVDLLVAGEGRELPRWKARAAGTLPPGRIRFLGYRTDVPRLLAAADLLIHPARYEAYGLAVHEALCCGVPAIVSAAAGVAERYPAALQSLLLRDPESAAELAERIRSWQEAAPSAEIDAFGAVLRQRTWSDMGREIAEAVEAPAVPV